MMTAKMFASYNQSSNCCTTAAGTSCARIINIMDTAVIMVVSIFVRLISLRLRIGSGT